MADDGKPVDLTKLSPELLQGLLAIASKAGLDVSSAEVAMEFPTLRFEWGWRRMGRILGETLRPQNIFLRAGEVGTVEVATGKWIGFTARNFAGWVEEFAAFTFKGEKTVLIAEHAAMLLAQFSFRGQLRELEAIHTIRMPVQRAEGRVEWLAPGYDAETRIFTAETLSYELDWTIEQGLDFIEARCAGYPWMRAEGEDGKNLRVNRSFAVHVAAMLGVYCRAFFGPGILRPMFPYLSNQSGSGKSTLVQMAVAPVHGLVAPADKPQGKDDLAKQLDAAAQAFAPFLFFDDIGDSLFSPQLNRFITSPKHSGRILGSKDWFEVPAMTQLFLTGNNVRGSRDLARRALICELFYAGDIEKREFAEKITPAWLARPETRRGFLAALAAIVRHWTSATEEQRAVLAKLKGLPTFDEWTTCVAGIVVFAGIANPLAPPLAPLDEDEDQMKDLLIAAADTISDEEKALAEALAFDIDKLVDIAWDRGLVEDVVGVRTEKGLDGKAKKRFGIRLRTWRGRELVDGKGRMFRFGHRRQKHGATYPLTFI